MTQQHTLRDRLRTLLAATRTGAPCETAQEAEEGADPSISILSLVVVSRPSSATTHWAVAVVTDERSRRCRVFHVSDTHILGLRALGWTCFVQDETLDRSSGYPGGVRVGLVEEDELDRLEEAICGDQLPPPTPDTWDCADWTLAVLRHLEDHGFALVTYGLDGGALVGQLLRDSRRAQSLTERHRGRPVFVPLSLPS